MLRKYRKYPSEKTVILLVNVQNAFMINQAKLLNKISDLLGLARKNNIQVAYAPYMGGQQAYPSPAQLKFEKLISTISDGVLTPRELAENKGDIMLAQRRTLSAFSETRLHEVLENADIEHIVLAGPFANLALDSTMRDGVQHGYHVTILNDCISAESYDAKQAFILTAPRYAQTIINIDEFQKKIIKN